MTTRYLILGLCNEEALKYIEGSKEDLVTTYDPNEAMVIIANNKIELVIENVGQNQEAEWNYVFEYLNDKEIKTLFLTKISEEEESEKKAEYMRIDIKRITKHNILPCEIFIELSDDKYVKVINKNQLYSEDLINGLIEKNIRWLFVKNTEFKTMSDYLYKNISSELKTIIQQRAIITPTHIGLEVEKVAILQDMVRYLHIEPEVNERILESTTDCINIIKKSQALQEVIKNFSTTGDYIYSHSLLVSYICGIVAIKMSWGTDQTLKKLGMAALLHDVYLQDERYATIDSVKDFSHFSDQEIKLIKRHPIEAADIINNMRDMPPDVSNIILCHHERPDGDGFPRGLTSVKISQIAALFITCHSFVDIIYEKVFTPELLMQARSTLMNRYDQGNFRPGLEGIVKVIDEALKFSE